MKCTMSLFLAASVLPLLVLSTPVPRKGNGESSDYLAARTPEAHIHDHAPVEATQSNTGTVGGRNILAVSHIPVLAEHPQHETRSPIFGSSKKDDNPAPAISSLIKSSHEVANVPQPPAKPAIAHLVGSTDKATKAVGVTKRELQHETRSPIFGSNKKDDNPAPAISSLIKSSHEVANVPQPPAKPAIAHLVGSTDKATNAVGMTKREIPV